MFRNALLLTLIASASVWAQRSAKPGEDWVSLFNGKDLSGWVEIGKEKWIVDSGVIHGEAIGKEYGYLQTAKKYKDFHLSMRFKCEGNGNSGLFFHVDFKPGTPHVSQGLQVEIDCSINRHSGGVYGDGRQWIVWPAPENEGVIRQSDWNDLQVKIDPPRFGVDVVVDLELPVDREAHRRRVLVRFERDGARPHLAHPPLLGLCERARRGEHLVTLALVGHPTVVVDLRHVSTSEPGAPSGK